MSGFYNLLDREIFYQTTGDRVWYHTVLGNSRHKTYRKSKSDDDILTLDVLNSSNIVNKTYTKDNYVSFQETECF